MVHPLSSRHLQQDEVADLIGDSVKMDIAYEQIPSAKTIDVFYRLVPEELNELREAMEDFRAGCQSGTPQLEELNHLCKEAFDVLTITISFMHMLGVDIGQIWQACVANNYEKIDPATGLYRKNVSGKIVKPEGWQPVDLKPVLAADFQKMQEEYRKFGENK